MGKDREANVDKLVGDLRRFYSGEVEARKAIQEYLDGNPSANKGQIFQALSGGSGRPKSHMSAYKEGDFRSPVKKFRRGGAKAHRY